ncbi:hypothetical protein [Endozoicomonas sp. GU-1]|uniref:hypothetical protein n=1 Tax=Endozoicomonas sp. GU-1 TaxID=3009078 RepID=UPI0022B4920D|nr:hypothetical protein [Endozoicomonas sp. GU-1]WBA83111.1 hypothetical protein O2T12_08345 [Endozoicomonas sp. GU-1]
MAVIVKGNTTQLTGYDAFKYEYKAHKGIKGIIKGIIGFFLGRKVTLAEGRSPLKSHAPEDRLSTVLPERSVQELAPADETQLTKGINPRDRSSSVSTSQPAQLNADSLSGSGSNVWERSFSPARPEFQNSGPQPPVYVNEYLFPDESQNPQSELPDEFDHIAQRFKKQIPLLSEGSDSLSMKPEPIDQEILVSLGLSLDFPDQEEKVIMDWLDSSDFMDKSARPETATLVKYLIHRCVFKQNKNLFMDICASLGSRAGSKYHIPFRHENLSLAFVAFHKQLLSNDKQWSGKACRVIGMWLINELDSYLKEIEPPKTQEKTDSDDMYERWVDKISETGMVFDENQLIDISHGGGRYYLKKFLNGQASGYYHGECGPIGIQVHPHYTLFDGLNNDKDIKRRELEEYSQTSLQFLDLPAQLTAKIPTKHLITGKFGNEAIIKASSVSELVEPEITVLNRSLPPEESDHQEPEP